MDGSRPVGRPLARLALVVAGFAVATAWALWPLPRDAATRLLDVRAFYGRGAWLFGTDAWLVQWILGWDTRALTTAPWRLFDANIFHPAPWTLALSEHLLGYWPLFGPVYLATGNPTLAYNLTLLAAFALSGTAMFLLVRHWTRSAAAGAVAGFVFAFAPWRIGQLGHLQLLGLWAAPLVLLGWDRALALGRRGDVGFLAGALLAQCLCSYYLAYCTLVVLAMYAVATGLGARARRLAAAGGAVALALGAFAAVSLPYVWVRGAGLLPEQPLATQAALGIEGWRPYVWPVPGGTGMRPFQGRVALVLAALALVPLGAVWGRSARPRAAVVAALVLVALAGWSLARGPRGGALYAVLWDWVPGFSATRVPARFMIVVSFATAALAGIGWAPLAARAGRWAPLATAGVLGAVAVDTGLHAVRVPLAPAPDAAGPPAVTRWLAEHGEGRPVLELPVRRFAGDVPGAAAEQLYALRSLVHGLPILPGRSGYVPPSYELLMAFARRLPDARAVDGLASLARLGWVVAYGAQVGPWSHPPPTLRLVATLGSDRVYRVEAGAVPDWQPALVARLRGAPEETTFAGTPLAPLTPRALENEVAAFGAPRRLRPGGTGIVSVAVRNAGHRPWPALALDPERVVVLRLAWRDGHGRRVRLALPPVRGIADTPPGAVATFQAAVPAPAEPGAYRLSARLAQGRVARRLGGQTRARVDVAP